MGLASDVDGLRLVLRTALGDRYSVRVSDDGSVVGLWRRLHEKRPAPRGTDLGASRGGAMRLLVGRFRPWRKLPLEEEAVVLH